jgi:protein-disulfide isomerase
MNEILDAALTKDDFVVPEEFAVTLDPALFTITATDHVRGSADAPVKIFEYSDIDCPFCIKFHPEISKLASTRTDVAWIYRHHPLDNLHPNARMKAEATQCAAELGGKDAFWTLLDTLMK